MLAPRPRARAPPPRVARRTATGAPRRRQELPPDVPSLAIFSLTSRRARGLRRRTPLRQHRHHRPHPGHTRGWFQQKATRGCNAARVAPRGAGDWCPGRSPAGSPPRSERSRSVSSHVGNAARVYGGDEETHLLAGVRRGVHHRAPRRRPVARELRDERRPSTVPPAPHLDEADVTTVPLIFISAHTVYWALRPTRAACSQATCSAREAEPGPMSFSGASRCGRYCVVMGQSRRRPAS